MLVVIERLKALVGVVTISVVAGSVTLRTSKSQESATLTFAYSVCEIEFKDLPQSGVLSVVTNALVSGLQVGPYEPKLDPPSKLILTCTSKTQLYVTLESAASFIAKDRVRLKTLSVTPVDVLSNLNQYASALALAAYNILFKGVFTLLQSALLSWVV